MTGHELGKPGEEQVGRQGAQESKDALWGRLGEGSVTQPWRCSLGASRLLMVTGAVGA